MAQEPANLNDEIEQHSNVIATPHTRGVIDIEVCGAKLQP